MGATGLEARARQPGPSLNPDSCVPDTLLSDICMVSISSCYTVSGAVSSSACLKPQCCPGPLVMVAVLFGAAQRAATSFTPLSSLECGVTGGSRFLF